MNRSLALSVLALTTTLVGAACSSPKSSPSFDPGSCARVSACFGTALGGSFGQSCEELYAEITVGALGDLGTEGQVAGAAVDCITSAADCAAMKACIQPTAAQAAACGSKTGDVCSGDVVVECGGTPSASNCAAAGAHCIDTGSAVMCGSATCDENTTQPSCDGDLLVECNSGVLQTTGCANAISVSCGGGATGSSCTTTVTNTCAVVGGKAQCVGSGEACDESTFKTSCDGTTIVSCGGGKVGRIDCAAYGVPLTCKAQTDGSVSCDNVGTACTSSAPETCNAGVIGYCWFGSVTTLDCKAYGLSGCSTTTTNGATWASCTE